MKRILKVVLSVFLSLSVFGIISKPTKVEAATARVQSSFTSYWFNAKKSSGQSVSGDYAYTANEAQIGAVDYITVGGQPAYCLEPHKNISGFSGRNFTTRSFGSLSTTLKTRLWLITNYGYTNRIEASLGGGSTTAPFPTNHATTRYYIATQLLVWRALGWNVNVYSNRANATADNSGNRITFNAEITEIERLISLHETMPSFNGETYTMKPGDSITLVDDNNVLDTVSLQVVAGIKLNVNGNELTITYTGTQDLPDSGVTIIMEKISTFGDKTDMFVWGNGSAQKLLTGGSKDPNPVGKIYLTRGDYDPVEIQVFKRDVETNIPLQGAKFELYNIDDPADPQFIVAGETGSNGKISFGYQEFEATYKLVETELPEGYEPDGGVTEWIFTPSDDAWNEIYVVSPYNRLRSFMLQLYKQDEDGRYALNGAYFSVVSMEPGEMSVQYVTGAIYITDDPGKDYQIYTKATYERVRSGETLPAEYDETTNQDGEILIYPDDGIYFIVNGQTRSVTEYIVKKGMIYVPGLRYGRSYNVCEYKAPLGYALPNIGACSVVTPKEDLGIDVIEMTKNNRTLYSPPTGDNSYLGLIVFFTVLSGLSIIFVKTKKDEK